MQASPAVTVSEGYVAVPGGEIAYRRAGGGPGRPLLVVAGGPGAGSRYLRRLDGLATQREVVYYDHLGSGLSDRPDDPALWTFARFIDEIALLRAALALPEVHLFGHSWGSWLVVEYLIGARSDGVCSAVLANGAAAAADFSAGVREVGQMLSPDAAAALRQHADDPWSQDPAYVDALVELYTRHLVDRPDQARKLLSIQRGTSVYRTMMGPHEAALVGTLADWDRRDDLHRIDVPTLVAAGAHDHNTPASAHVLHERISSSAFVLFENSRHNPFDDEEARFLQVVSDFLRRND